MRRRPILTGLIAALLLLQWGAAFGHCLRLAAPAPGALLHLEICTLDGLQSVTLAAPGHEEQSPGPAATAPLVCPACTGPAALALPPPSLGLAAPVRLAEALERPALAPSSPPPGPRCQPEARAPPNV